MVSPSDQEGSADAHGHDGKRPGTSRKVCSHSSCLLNPLNCNMNGALILYSTKHAVKQSVKAMSAFIWERKKIKEVKAFQGNNSHLILVMKLQAGLSHSTRVEHCNTLAEQCVLLLNLPRASTWQRLTCGGDSTPMNRNTKTFLKRGLYLSLLLFTQKSFLLCMPFPFQPTPLN